MQTRTPRVWDHLIALNAHGEIALNKLIWYVGEPRPQTVSIRSVTHGATGHAAKANLEQLKPLSIFTRTGVITGIKQVWRIREARRIQQLIWRTHTQQSTQNIKNTAQRVCSPRQRSGVFRFEQSALGNANFNQVVKTIVERNLRVHDIDGE